MKWDPKGWFEMAVLQQEPHPFIPVELNREQALALLKYLKDQDETLEALKRQLAGSANF